MDSYGGGTNTDQIMSQVRNVLTRKLSKVFDFNALTDTFICIDIDDFREGQK